MARLIRVSDAIRLEGLIEMHPRACARCQPGESCRQLELLRRALAAIDRNLARLDRLAAARRQQLDRTLDRRDGPGGLLARHLDTDGQDAHRMTGPSTY